MQKEFLLYTKEPLAYPLDESIVVCSEIPEDAFVISNIKYVNTQIFAPEVDFYRRNTQDTLSGQMRNIKTLYEIRSSTYDLAQDMDHGQAVGKKLLIVLREKNSELKEKLDNDGFTCLELSSEEIENVSGHIGALTVATTKRMRGEIKVDQIIWTNAPDFAMKQSGVYDPVEIGWEKTIETLYENDGVFSYKNFVQYNPDICQYKGRLLEETCGKCEEVCPSVAIIKTDEDRQLHFSDVDCHGCGGCVSVCPSGALDFTQMPRDAFAEAATYFKGHTALLLPRQVEIDDLPLPEGVLPFAMEGRKYLHEAHLLMLLQQSGNPVIFYTDFVSKGTGDAIRMINEIFERKYQKKAVYVCMNISELEAAFAAKESLEECRYEMDDTGLRKRESFTYRLAHLVGEEDLGVLETGEHIHYADMQINEAACTLCMSCVGVCNVAALTAHPEDNTLKFNPSLCTDCGYCEVACPEKDCLEMVHDTLSLAPEYFKKRTMAHDELFACVECGAEFATVKSVEKIATMMKPIFGDDEVKIRTLYCCADCKPKVMFRDHLEHNMEGRKSV